MSLLTDYLDAEEQLAKAFLERDPCRNEAVIKIVQLAITAIQGEAPIRENWSLVFGRLTMDAVVALEQAFICVLRGQPRLGWASMRFAAEACKDIECLDHSDSLIPLWLKLADASTLDEIKKADKAFSKARKSVPKTATIKMCQATMDLCHVLGAHPNATSFAFLGPSSKGLEDGKVVLPSRVTEPEHFDFHFGQMMLHGMIIAQNLASFRAQTLDGEPKVELEEAIQKLGQDVHPHFPEEMREKWNRILSRSAS